MKKWLSRLRTRGFWVALVGALTLIFSRLGLEDAPALAQKITEIAASILLLCGIAVSPFALSPEKNKDISGDADKDTGETEDGTEKKTSDGENKE